MKLKSLNIVLVYLSLILTGSASPVSEFISKVANEINADTPAELEKNMVFNKQYVFWTELAADNTRVEFYRLGTENPLVSIASLVRFYQTNDPLLLSAVQDEFLLPFSQRFPLTEKEFRDYEFEQLLPQGIRLRTEILKRFAEEVSNGRFGINKIIILAVYSEKVIRELSVRESQALYSRELVDGALTLATALTQQIIKFENPDGDLLRILNKTTQAIENLWRYDQSLFVPEIEFIISKLLIKNESDVTKLDMDIRSQVLIEKSLNISFPLKMGEETTREFLINAYPLRHRFQDKTLILLLESSF